jgi:hypothetical protein
MSIEFSLKTRVEEVREIIVNCLKELKMLDGTSQKIEQELYTVYGTLKKIEPEAPKLINFQRVILAKEEFYPLFFGEEEYKNILCLKARKNGQFLPS